MIKRHYCLLITIYVGMGGTVASYLVGLFTDQAVWVQALVQDIVLCSWARQFIVTVPLHQGV